MHFQVIGLMLPIKKNGLIFLLKMEHEMYTMMNDHKHYTLLEIAFLVFEIVPM